MIFLFVRCCCCLFFTKWSKEEPQGEKVYYTIMPKKIKTFASVIFSIYSVFILYFYSRLLCFARKTTLLVKTGGNQEAILPLKATCISTFKINYSKKRGKTKGILAIFFLHESQSIEN